MIKNIKEDLIFFGLLVGPFLLVGFIVYFLQVHTYSVYEHSMCTECTHWKTHDNGANGKYRREWEECANEESFPCIVVHHRGFTFSPHCDSLIERGRVIVLTNDWESIE